MRHFEQPDGCMNELNAVRARSAVCTMDLWGELAWRSASEQRFGCTDTGWRRDWRHAQVSLAMGQALPSRACPGRCDEAFSSISQFCF